MIERVLLFIEEHPVINKLIFIALALLCLSPIVTPTIALALGIVLAQLIKNPFEEVSSKGTQWMLKASVVGLGFGMNVNSALSAGKEGFLLTVASIGLTLTLGLLLTKFLGIDKKIGKLISSGTAICGGSAIAAVSPIIKANSKQISIAIGIVFLLNSIALFIFPSIGHYFNLTQHQFGIWSAVAIHDTSSVVGAADIYGDEALKVATTVKLARALWILPLSVVFAAIGKRGAGKVKVPYFIGLFILAIIVNTYIPASEIIAPYMVIISKLLLTLVLFLIGTTLNFSSLKQVGAKPLLLAISIWAFVSVFSLFIILHSA